MLEVGVGEGGCVPCLGVSVAGNVESLEMVEWEGRMKGVGCLYFACILRRFSFLVGYWRGHGYGWGFIRGVCVFLCWKIKESAHAVLWDGIRFVMDICFSAGLLGVGRGILVRGMLLCERVNGLCFRTSTPLPPPCASDSMLRVEIWSVVW